MEKILTRFTKFNNGLAGVLLAFGALITAVLVLSLFAGAVSRYLIGGSHAFLEEIPRMIVPFAVFPLMGPLLRTGRHISVDVLPDRLKPPGRHILMVLVYGVCFLVAAQFTIAGMSAVSHFKTMGLVSVTEWVVPMWCIYAAFPLGFGLLCLFALELMLIEGHKIYRFRHSAAKSAEKGKKV